jgi:RimJ/RimL family protein N-acetyltransferase
MPRVPRFETPIETERLLLRAFRREDLEALYAMQSDPEIARFLPRQSRSREETEQVLARRIASRELVADDDELSLAVERRDDGRTIGDLTLWLRSAESSQAEIGYVFAADAGGRGFATEAVRALVGLAFDGLGAHRVYARADARNGASRRLLERLGMRLEAHFRESEIFKGEWGEEVVYAILAAEWPPAPPAK